MDIPGIMAAILAALSTVAPAPTGVWAETLTALDERRSEAFERGDVGLLDDVYARGSELRAADAVMVRGYARRGWEVERVTFRLVDVEVIAERRRSVTLEVIDQLQPVRVRQAGRPWMDLPRDQPTQRRMVLTRTNEGWRIAGITRLAG